MAYGQPNQYGYGGYSPVATTPTQSFGSPIQTSVGNFSPVATGYAPTPSPVSSGNLSPISNSRGTSPLSAPVPNLAFANPATLASLSANLSNLVYSVAAGGYLTSAEANNANSYYNKFGAGGGGDPSANRQASAFYNYIGSLPTRPVGTPALNQLYAATGTSPAPGPSYNSILSNFLNNSPPFVQDAAKKAGFGSTYGGPFATGGY